MATLTEFVKVLFKSVREFNPQNWTVKTAGRQHEIECNEPVLDHCLAAKVYKTLCHLQFMHKSNSINRYSSQFTFSAATLHLQFASVFWKGEKEQFNWLHIVSPLQFS